VTWILVLSLCGGAFVRSSPVPQSTVTHEIYRCVPYELLVFQMADICHLDTCETKLLQDSHPAFNVKSESELHSIGVTEWYSLKTK
jgi:hypothetical protein